MPGREEILKQLRILGKGTRGASPAILEMADDTLYEAFEQLKRGLSCRAVARFLRKSGMRGSENSLQQSVSLFRQRIAPLLAEESATPALPKTPIKLPANFSSLPSDGDLSLLTQIVKNYGECLRQVTEKAAQNHTALSEDTAKHAKAYSDLVATKVRLEQTVMKSGPIGATQDQEDLRFDALANKVHDFLTDNGRDTETMHKMWRAAERMLKRMADKCIQLEKDPVTGEYHEVTGRPRRTSTYDPEPNSID